MLKGIDTRALSKIEHHNGMNAFKQNVLREKEEELVSIPVVAMRGLVAPTVASTILNQNSNQNARERSR